MKGSRCNSIIIEGIDRLGKSTQTKLLVAHLQSEGYRVAFVKFPYNDGVSFPLVYWMLKNGLARRFQNAFQVIHFFNKLYFQLFVLPKMLRDNDFIVFDRWTISMYAYGIADGANKWLTQKMLSYIAEPDYTVILDGNPHITSRGDSYENDYKMQNDVRSLYISWVASHPCCVGMVNANQPVQDVFRDILQYLNVHSGVMKE